MTEADEQVLSRLDVALLVAGSLAVVGAALAQATGHQLAAVGLGLLGLGAVGFGVDRLQRRPEPPQEDRTPRTVVAEVEDQVDGSTWSFRAVEQPLPDATSMWVVETDGGRGRTVFTVILDVGPDDESAVADLTRACLRELGG